MNRFNSQEAGLVQRRRRYRIPRRLVHGDALPREGGFIHGGMSLTHDAIRRDAFTRAHGEFLTDPELLDGNDLLLSVTQDGRRLRRKLQERTQRIGCAPL